MKLIRKCAVALIVFMFGSAFTLLAEEVQSRYLLILSNDGSGAVLTKQKVTDDLLFRKVDSQTLLVESPDESQTLDIPTIASIGVVYGIESSVDELINDQSDAEWTVTDMNGTTVRHGHDGRPDLSGLRPNAVYIVTKGSKTFKYLNIK